MISELNTKGFSDRLLSEYMEAMFSNASPDSPSTLQLLPLFQNTQELAKTIKFSDLDRTNSALFVQAMVLMTSVRLLNKLVKGSAVYNAVFLQAKKASMLASNSPT